MITIERSELLTCKMSELESIAQNKEIAIPTTKTNSCQWLAEKATNFRYSSNPKSMTNKHKLLYSGESATNPVFIRNDKDEVSYFVIK